MHAATAKLFARTRRG